MEPARRPVVLIPPFVALAAALVRSLALHGPAYLGLGVLKQVLESRPRARSMEIEIVTSSAGEVAPASPEPAPLTEPLEEPADEPERARREREQPSAPRAERAPEPPPEPEIAPPAPVVAPPPPPPPQAERTAVLQRSRDPSVPPPPNARVRAAENNRVEEETIARAQSDQSTELEAQQEARGDAEEQVQADLRDAEGDDRRRPTPEEVQDRPRPDEAPSVSNRPAVARAAEGSGASGGTQTGGAAPAPSAGT
ncbi:MAG: hypothetical protein IT378_17445, partial [Sandaracinaceae bacterium]|nr:hypothetical protein [Sandaracinaceae bacterium]